MGVGFCQDRTGMQKPVTFSECDFEHDSDSEFKSGGTQQKSLASSSVKKKSDESERVADVDTERKPSIDGYSDEEKKQKTKESEPNVELTVWNEEVLEHRKQYGDFVFMTTEIIPHEEKDDNIKISAPSAVSFAPEDEPSDLCVLNQGDVEALKELDIVKIRSLPDLQFEEISAQFKRSDNKPKHDFKERRRLRANSAGGAWEHSTVTLFHHDSNWSDEKVSSELKEMRHHYLMLSSLSLGQKRSVNRKTDDVRGEHLEDPKNRRRKHLKLKGNQSN